MANSLTNINDSKVVSECLAALNIALNPVRVFTLSVSSEQADKNEVINVPVVTARTASTNATNYEDGNTTIASVQVNLATNLSASWHLTAIEASKTSTDAFAAAGRECVYAVMAAAYNACLNKVVRASYGTSTEQALAYTAFDSDSLIDGRNTCMNTLKWPRVGQKMSLVLDGSYYANLMKDPAIKDLSASGVPAGKELGPQVRFAGFDIYEDGMIASCTPYSATEYLRGFYCLPSAMAVGIRPPAKVDSGTFEVNEIVTDPVTGISANYRRWVNTQTNVLWGTIEVLFGAVACQSGGLYRIVSQSSS